MNINTVQQYNDYFGIETRHPLVSVIDGREAKPLRFCRKLYNLYAILLKDTDCGQLKYGRSIYDYQKGAMLFLAPGQVLGSEDDGLLHQPEGWVLVFHPRAFTRNRHWPISWGTTPTSLTMRMRPFTFRDKERKTVIECNGKE